MKYDGPLSFDAIQSFVKGLKKQEDEEWTTPYQPRNYNKEQYKYEFSQEYLSTQKPVSTEEQSQSKPEQEAVQTQNTTQPSEVEELKQGAANEEKEAEV
mmetsp:Transcript_23997/g.36862  ORF Transcript_23997/g.36862 Transcript_23997/m.36862 type:complete len:99 (-) Transcript_23997:952-1248(-)